MSGDAADVDVAVVGAGAAGLAAAIFAAEASAPARPGAASRIVVLDGAPKIGAKILISGGGRCNVTHFEVIPADFNGSRNVIRNVLAAFDVAATVEWFAGMGVALKREETGKLFPVTDKARTVLDALVGRCEALGVEIRGGHRVHAVRPIEDANATTASYTVRHEHGELAARCVIIATGGRSLPRTGSDGSGWDLARSLGHTVTDTHPALVPLVLRPEMFHAQLSGLSHPAELSVIAGGKRIDRRTGSLLWTHFGISGPVVLDASRHWVIASAGGAAVELRCGFLPGEDFDGVHRWLVATAAERPKQSLLRCLAAVLPEKLARCLAEAADADPAVAMGQLPRDTRRRMAHALTALPLPVERDRGWDYAEVTAGGVPLNEIDYRTMESRRAPGLYLIGEMLDCDGRIGGFNFQWAWSTAHLAGRAASSSRLSATLHDN
jgi:hypothetical protein